MARKSAATRFWEKVAKQPGEDGCWLWTGRLNERGYGQFDYEGKTRRAHRMALFLTYGEWPKPFPEYSVDHLCRNRHCVRPDHLEDVPHRENLARGENPIATVLRTGKCRNGHDDWAINKKDGTRACRECRRIRHRAWAKTPKGRALVRGQRRRARARKKALMAGAA